MKRLLFSLLFIYSCAVPPAKADGPDGYLIIPAISLYKSVVLVPDSDLSVSSHYYDLTELNDGVGYLEHLMWGNTIGGRTILVGHTPGAFNNIHVLDYGDEIIVGMGDEFYQFHVFKKYMTHESDNSLFDIPPNEFEMVLVTCTDIDNERLIIKAK
jgi:LPXTG-site transpeptidase (sortase) family protein